MPVRAQSRAECTIATAVMAASRNGQAQHTIACTQISKCNTFLPFPPATSCIPEILLQIAILYKRRDTRLRTLTKYFLHSLLKKKSKNEKNTSGCSPLRTRASLSSSSCPSKFTFLHVVRDWKFAAASSKTHFTKSATSKCRF